MYNFEYSYKNLKLRSCKRKDTNLQEYQTFEIVESDNSTLAYWEKDNNVYDIKFIDSKHLEYHNNIPFWELINFGKELIKGRTFNEF